MIYSTFLKLAVRLLKLCRVNDENAQQLLDVSAGQRRCFLRRLVCVPRHVNAAVEILAFAIKTDSAASPAISPKA